MRVVVAEPVAMRGSMSRIRSLDIEFAGLLIASTVVIFGVALAGVAKVARLDEAALPAPVIPLYALKAPSDLEPALGMYTSSYERKCVARALFDRATSPQVPLDHVGALADVKVPAARIRTDRRLLQLRERLAARDQQEVPVLSRADVLSLKPAFAVRSLEQFRSELARAAGVFVAVFFAAHLFRRWRRHGDEPLLLPAMMLLCGVGLTTMCALRDPIRDAIAAGAFAGGVALGIAALVAVSEVDFESSFLRRAVMLPLALACGLATVLLLFGSGPGTSGVKVNLFGAQPVEVIKLLVVFALAAYFGRRVELLRELSERGEARRP